MSAFPLQSVVIVGGGVSGWLAAATLGRIIGSTCQVRVVELPVDNAIGGALDGGIASVPSLHRLLGLLKIDEIALLRATDGTFRLGTRFGDWRSTGESYFAGFGTIGAKLDAVPFQHHWLRLAAHGEHAHLDEFSMAAQAAKLERFAPPSSDARSVLSLYAYAWHFDARSLRDLLRARAHDAKVTAIAGAVVDVQRAPAGGIDALVLEDGTRVAADFFIDCSDAAAVLGPVVGAGFEDWAAWLPCDRIQSVRCAPENRLPPYSECTAEATGWSFRLPLQHAVIHSRAYASDLVSDAQVRTALLELPDAAGGAPRVRELMRGRPKQFWVDNVLLLPGDAFDPLESAGLHLAQTGITRFLAHFPAARSSAVDAAEYNRLTAEEYVGLRDLTVLHYHATQRTDAPFWNACRAMRIPDSLAQRLALFRDSARLAIAADDHCGVDGWLAVLSGQGVVPRSYDPLADVTPLATTRAALAAMAAEMRERAATLSAHAEYLARRGATAPAASAR